MVLPAAIAAAAPAATKLLGMASASGGAGGLLGGIGKLASGATNLMNWAKGPGADLLNLGGKGLGYLGSFLGGRADNNAAKAYQDYLNGITVDMANQLTKRADKYDTKLQNQFNLAEPQYQAEANTQLPELTQLVTDIANQSAEAQRQNQRQINASLAQQGVRGGQASILANRATGELNRDLQRDINRAVYNEAANRQNSRLNYYSQKAMTPWNTMSNAYGNSMVGANNALSGAQGNVYANAYNRAMANYGNTQKKGLF